MKNSRKCNLNEELLAAVELGYFRVVKELIELGVNPEINDQDDVPLVEIAFRGSQFDIFELLIEAGENRDIFLNYHNGRNILTTYLINLLSDSYPRGPLTDSELGLVNYILNNLSSFEQQEETLEFIEYLINSNINSLNGEQIDLEIAISVSQEIVNSIRTISYPDELTLAMDYLNYVSRSLSEDDCSHASYITDILIEAENVNQTVISSEEYENDGPSTIIPFFDQYIDC